MKSSGPILVNISRFQSIFVDFSLIILEAFFLLHQISVNFGQVLSVLVSFNQVTQDRNARFSYRQEGGAKQHPNAG